MSPEVVYTMAQAVKAAGVSEASIRNYTSGRYAVHYADFLTPGARPGTGQPRNFTHDDIALLAYVHSRTRQGATHETIRGEIAGGALADFEPPEVSARQAEQARQAARQEEPAPEEPPHALAVVQDMARQVAAFMSSQVQDAQARADSLADQLREAESRAAAAEREAEIWRAEVEALRKRGLLARLFGR